MLLRPDPLVTPEENELHATVRNHITTWFGALGRAVVGPVVCGVHSHQVDSNSCAEIRRKNCARSSVQEGFCDAKLLCGTFDNVARGTCAGESGGNDPGRKKKFPLK